MRKNTRNPDQEPFHSHNMADLLKFTDTLERNTAFLSVFLEDENYHLIAESDHKEALSSIVSAVYGRVALQIRSVFSNNIHRDDLDFGNLLDLKGLLERHKETINYLNKSANKKIAHVTFFTSSECLQTYDLLELCKDFVDLAQDTAEVNVGDQIEKWEDCKRIFLSLFQKIIDPDHGAAL